jgi:hypothetical protein
MGRLRNPAYIGKQLSHEYLNEEFIPCLASLRSHDIRSRERAICLMDSAFPHVSERCLKSSGDNRLLAMGFRAHTTHLFQAIDLVFFGMLKKLKASAQSEFDATSANDQLTKPIQGCEQTLTSIAIPASFHKAGLVLDTSVRPFRLRFDEEKVRENAGFREIWHCQPKSKNCPEGERASDSRP